MDTLSVSHEPGDFFFYNICMNFKSKPTDSICIANFFNTNKIIIIILLKIYVILYFVKTIYEPISL